MRPTVITSITIDRLRGIKHGEVPGLTGLSILVGPNGCGKSTVLDALMIGASPQPGDAIGRAVRRRVETRFGLPWLLWRRGEGGEETEITVGNIDAFDSTRVWLSGASEATARMTRGGVVVGSDVKVSFDPDNGYVATRSTRPSPFLRLIEASPGAIHSPLPGVFTEAELVGGVAFVDEVLKELVPSYGGLKILSDPDNQAVLYMSQGGQAVPVSLAGEGVSALVRTLLELGVSRGDGTALLEEPEVHQHPRSLRLMAQGICESVKRGVQVVVTTHSSELIDALLYFADTTGVLDQSSVHLVRLRDGELTAARLDGAAARFQTVEIGEDLR